MWPRVRDKVLGGGHSEILQLRGGSMGRKGFNTTVFLSKVGSGKTIVQRHKGQIIFTQGDPADAVFFVQSGKVKLTVLSGRGKEAVIALLRAGSFFGEGCLNGQLGDCRPRQP